MHLIQAVTGGNEAISACFSALQLSKAAPEPSQSTDRDSRELYTQEARKYLGAVSLLLRKQFKPLGDGQEQSGNDAIVEFTPPGEGGGEGQVAVKVPESAPRFIMVAEADLPEITLGEREAFITECTKRLKLLQIDSLKDSSSHDPLKVCMPARVLSSWQKSFLSQDLDHVALTQLQHNWRQSLALFNTLIKEARLAARTVTSHIDTVALRLHVPSFS